MRLQKGRIPAFCRMCKGRCALLVTVEGGKVVKVEGDPEAPSGWRALCAKGLALPEILNHPDRLKYPQLREGERGGGKWVRISWEEALTTIARRLGNFKSEFGPESVILGIGDPKGLELAFVQRFASVFGTPNVATPGHVCHMPGEQASIFTHGSACLADDEHPPSCIVVWGSNLLQTHSGSLSSVQLRSALNQGAKLIVIDPRKTNLAPRADIWIRPRPGSDGELALGMIKVIVDEKLYDEEFVAKWTTGFEQLREHIKDYPLSEVEEITWVAREQIEKAARLYAQTKPATIQWGNALDHSINSFQACRAISILRAITGNLDVPGGDILLGTLPVTRAGRFILIREFPRNRERMIGSEFKLAARLAFTPRETVIRAILEGKPYPVKAALLFGSNPLLSYSNAKETYEALMKLELLVVSELFMTPTAELADIVLPAATVFEFDEVSPYPPMSFIQAYPKIADPPGECWSDMKIINELAKRLEMGEYFWRDEREALDLILEPSGLTFEEFKEKRFLQAGKEYRRYENGGFRTPSGRVEIYSPKLEELGYSPLPVYVEPPETPFSSPELAKEYPLILTSAKAASFYHSAHRNIASLRRMAPEPIAELNPDTAGKLGVEEGDWIYIETKRGKIRQKLNLNSDLDPRVVVAAYGWWFPERGASELYGWSESNINILTGSAPHEPALGSLGLRGMLCKVSRA